MKNSACLIGLFLCCFNLFSQVGINTTTPNAQLEISSSNQVAPANTDGIIIPKIDAFPVVNPTVAQNGMMVFLTTIIGVKTPGFYYWDNATISWIGISSTANGDKDWFKVGTTTAPNNITDDMFHDGKVGIGNLNPLSKLHVMNVTTGMIPNPSSIATIENSTDTYLSLLSNSESGILFGANGNSTNGAIIYNPSGIPNGMAFRTNNNANQMIITAAGNFSIGNFIPNYPLHFNSILGDKISLWGGVGPHYGFGIQGGLMQIHSSDAASDIAFGYGSSGAFTEAMRIKGNGSVGIGVTVPNAKLQINSSNQVAPANTDGIIIPKIDAFPTVNPTVAQNGMMVFLTTAATLNLPGFYYWNNSLLGWIGVGNSTNWNLTGNLGTNPATNFIGTADNNDIVFKRNNIRAGKLEFSNTAFGTNSFSPTNTGINNTAIGDYPLTSNTTGSYNVGIGTNALTTNSIGTRNTAVGVNSLLLNSSGSYNTSTGVNSLRQNSTASYNTAMGSLSLYGNTIGELNSAVGANSLFSNGSGNGNTALGTHTLYHNTTGSDNTAIGNYTLANSNLSGNLNTGVGALALYNTTGSSNVAIGSQAGYSITSGANNIAIGTNSVVPLPTGNFQMSIANQLYGSTLSTTALGKIGIGEPAPNAKLQISASNQITPANTDGIIIPKVNAFAATNPTLLQQGMMVYLTTAVGTNIPGFYYWDNATTSWIGVGTKNNWGLNGNTGTNAGTNFIGTTDNTDLIISTNSSMVMKLTPAGNVGIGNPIPLQKLDVNGNMNLKNFQNTYMINNNPVLSLSTSNTRNILVGTNAGPTTGGSDNCFLGDLAGFAGVSTSNNCLIGSKAGYNNYQGADNIFIGMAAGFTAVQSQANMFIGNNAGYNFNSGFNNVFIGHESGKTITGGSDNTYLGYKSGSLATGGNANSFFGAESGFNNSGAANSYFGFKAGNLNTTGNFNTFTGYTAGINNTQGSSNSFYGSFCGTANTTSSFNSFYGVNTGSMNQTGASNSFFGAYAGNKSTADFNSFFGGNAGVKTTTGANNTMLGYSAGQDNLAGVENTYIGSRAGIFTVGDYNTNVGFRSGASVFLGSTNTFIGYKADGVSGLSNATAIGANSIVGASNSLVLGGLGVNAVKVGIGVSIPTSELEVNGFTKLGSAAPAIKTLKFTGTTGAAQGSTTFIPHGVTSSKILAVNILLDFAVGSSVPSSYAGSNGYEFNYYTTATDIVVWTKSGNSANILSKPFRILITYEQ